MIAAPPSRPFTGSRMLCLNAEHQAIGWVRISSGGFDSASVDPRVVFSLALWAEG